MKPPSFEYYAPTTLNEALSHLAQHADAAKILAGGQSLIPTMNFRLAQPEILIDLNHVPELAYIRPTSDGGVSIGAMTRQRQVERDPVIAQHAPLVHQTMPFIAHPQIRNRGTFGGSLAHADPASELPAVTTALGARFRLQKATGSRWVTADDFFVDLFATALDPDELLAEIVLPPLPPRTGYAFREVSRRHGDYALVGATAVVTLDHNGVCQQAKLVLFSVGPGPVIAHEANAALIGQKLTPEAIQAAADLASTVDIDPQSDIHASVEFRRHLAKVLARHVLTEAAGRA